MALAEGALQSMAVTRWKIMAAALLLIATVSGAGAYCRYRLTPEGVVIIPVKDNALPQGDFEDVELERPDPAVQQTLVFQADAKVALPFRTAVMTAASTKMRGKGART
jgi:hypothetical protein